MGSNLLNREELEAAAIECLKLNALPLGYCISIAEDGLIVHGPRFTAKVDGRNYRAEFVPAVEALVEREAA